MYITILFQISVILLMHNSKNYFVNSVTDQQYDPQIVFLFRRAFSILQVLQENESKRHHQKMQDEDPESMEFFCDAKNGPGKRSPIRPTSIHQLRPGDIDIVAAMGDSLTAGNGVAGGHLLDIVVENRGIVYSIGGQGTWRKYMTLPNILKEFNPNLYGYAIGNSIASDRASKFNVAEIAAESRDTLYQAKVLRQRLIHDPKVNMTHDWKLLTSFIGGIDFCHYVCFEKNPQIPVDRHEMDLVKALRYMRDNIPRLMVNIILPPNIRPVVDHKRDILCRSSHALTCPCFAGKTKKWKDNVEKIVAAWYKKDEEIASRDEFNTNEFTVNVLPFSAKFEIPSLKNGLIDIRYFTTDCLHFSQRMHKIAALNLWNNLLQPVGQKNRITTLSIEPKCPTEERPFIATKLNS